MELVRRDLIEYYGINKCSYNDILNFKQVNSDYILRIPDGKPTIEGIVKVWVDSCVVSKEVIKTPKGTSIEGHNITGYNILVSGDIQLKIEYMGCDNVQSIYTFTSIFPICEYVVLPEDFNFNSLVNVSIIIEDIFSEQIDSTSIYNNITMLIVVDVC